MMKIFVPLFGTFCNINRGMQSLERRDLMDHFMSGGMVLLRVYPHQRKNMNKNLDITIF